jgi:hypothetical protein
MATITNDVTAPNEDDAVLGSGFSFSNFTGSFPS